MDWSTIPFDSIKDELVSFISEGGILILAQFLGLALAISYALKLYRQAGINPWK